MGKTKLTFLGTGTSQGVPIIGCKCDVCRSADVRDKRFRASAFIEHEGLGILVDAGPDFRSQMLAHGLCHLDAILLTHNHKDHTGGLDDVRSLNYIDKRAAEIYCEQNVLEDLIREYPYVFAFPRYPGAPEWNMHVIENKPFVVLPNNGDKELVWVHDIGYHLRLPDGTLIPTSRSLEDMIRPAVPAACSGRSKVCPGHPEVCSDATGAAVIPANGMNGATVIPVRGMHDKLPVLGFRFGDIAYITDFSSVPEEEFEKLKGLEHVTLNTVSYNKHHSHFSLYEALGIADRIGARHTWLTHLSHTFPRYGQFCKDLQELCAERGIHSTVQPAYDGLVIEG